MACERGAFADPASPRTAVLIECGQHWQRSSESFPRGPQRGTTRWHGPCTGKAEGEGSYSGTKDYNQRTKKFVDSGKVEDAARQAAPKSEQEAHGMQKAERLGKKRAKGEAPALKKP